MWCVCVCVCVCACARVCVCVSFFACHMQSLALLCTYVHVYESLIDTLNNEFEFNHPINLCTRSVHLCYGVGLFKQGISICKAYLADITDPPDVSAVLGIFTTVGNAGFIVGPLIGGYLSEWDPTFRAPFLAAGFLFLCIALLVSIVVPDTYTCQNVQNPSEHSKSTDRKHHLHSKLCAKNGAASSTVGGETEIKARPLRMLFRLLQQLNFMQGVHWKEFPDLIIERFLLTFAMLAFRQNLTPFLKGHFHIGYFAMGKILSWNGFVAMAAALLVQYVSRWYGRAVDSLLQHASLLLSASLLILTLSPSLPFVIIMLAPISFATSTLRIVQLDVNLQRGRPDEKGAIVGLSSSIAAFSRTLAPVLVGVLREVNSDLPGYVASVFSLFAFIVMVILPPHQTPSWLKKM